MKEGVSSHPPLEAFDLAGREQIGGDPLDAGGWGPGRRATAATSQPICVSAGSVWRPTKPLAPVARTRIRN
jgi:hypothetical protein